MENQRSDYIYISLGKTVISRYKKTIVKLVTHHLTINILHKKQFGGNAKWKIQIIK